MRWQSKNGCSTLSYHMNSRGDREIENSHKQQMAIILWQAKSNYRWGELDKHFCGAMKNLWRHDRTFYYNLVDTDIHFFMHA